MSRRPLYYEYIPAKESEQIKNLLHQVMAGKSKTIAFMIGCQHQDMLNRVSNQPRSPRKLELVLRILDCVEDPEPLIRWFNARYGFIPVRIPKVEPTLESLFESLARVGKEMGDLSRELLDATRDGVIELDEFKRLRKENMDLVQSSLELDLAIEQSFQKHQIR
ncbi:hypothetical protein KKI24_24325 [bacterium]|nr:hypothetical protein [bacterium]